MAGYCTREALGAAVSRTAGLRPLAEPVIDTTSEFSGIIIAVLGMAAKLEHKRIQERTAMRAARAAAKAAGKRLWGGRR